MCFKPQDPATVPCHVTFGTEVFSMHRQYACPSHFELLTNYSKWHPLRRVKNYDIKSLLYTESHKSFIANKN